MAPKKKLFPRDKVCEYCGKTFRAVTAYQIRKQVFCSRKCRTAVHGNGRKTEVFERPCRNCGKPIRVTPCHAETKFFCSRSCQHKHWAAGERNPAWEGGNSHYWKRKARERDDYTCQFPGCTKLHKGNGTHAHHKIPTSVGGEHSLENLITLCAKHHREMERQLLHRLVQTFPEETKKIIAELFSA